MRRCTFSRSPASSLPQIFFAQIFLTLKIIFSVPVSAQQPVAVRLQAEEVPRPGGEEEPADRPRGHRLQRARAHHGPALVQGHQPGTV